MKALPNELLLAVFECLPARSLLSSARVCRKWKGLAAATPLQIRVCLEISHVHHEVSVLLGFGSPTDSMSDAQCNSSHIVCNVLVGTDVIMNSSMLLEILRFRATLRFKLKLDFDLHSASIMTTTSVQRYPFLFGFTHISFKEPSSIDFDFIPDTCRALHLDTIQAEMDYSSLPSLQNITSLRIDTSGRFNNNEGYHRTRALAPIALLNLSVLILDGPWFQDLIDHGPRLLHLLKTLKTLTTLIADFDAHPKSLGPAGLHSLFSALPTLRHVGRLARVNKSFWKLFKKGMHPQIKTIELGRIKSPYSWRLDPEPGFMQFLAFGVLWAFPNATIVKIHLGYQQVDPDVLLDICKQLKEGMEGGERARKIGRIEFYQATDLFLVQDMRWNYVSLGRGDGFPLEIFISEEREGRTGRSKYFGPNRTYLEDKSISSK